MVIKFKLIICFLRGKRNYEINFRIINFKDVIEVYVVYRNRQ